VAVQLQAAAEPEAVPGVDEVHERAADGRLVNPLEDMDLHY
jgi:hypothetical protein